MLSSIETLKWSKAELSFLPEQKARRFFFQSQLEFDETMISDQISGMPVVSYRSAAVISPTTRNTVYSKFSNTESSYLYFNKYFIFEILLRLG